MSDKLKFSGILIVALVLGFVTGYIIVVTRGGAPSPLPAPVTAKPPVPPDAGGPWTTGSKSPRSAVPDPGDNGPLRRAEDVDPTAALLTGDFEPGTETAEPFADEEMPGYGKFTGGDLAFADMAVRIDFGEYQVRKGEAFAIDVSLTAPVLTSLRIPLKFDTALLEIIEGSGEAVGSTLRHGVEFYADQKRGMIMILQNGLPGAKNTEFASDEVFVRFRMRAKEAGDTELAVMRERASFVNGRGDPVEFELVGGSIEIE
jgi:hypothetical protein